MSDVNLYKLSEVSSCDGRGGQPAWVIYKDVVYDVTKYVNEHPGGLDAILSEAGKDATSTFDDVGHSADARAIMRNYKIGEIVEEEKQYDANGKKKKRAVAAPLDKPEGRSCINMVTCGLLG